MESVLCSLRSDETSDFDIKGIVSFICTDRTIVNSSGLDILLGHFPDRNNLGLCLKAM